MRFFTALSSVILAAVGAFSFAFSVNGYEGIAFALGAAMLLYGFFLLITYAIGFRRNIAPDTILVEGIYGMAFGLIILANFIDDQHISIYFGAWMMLTGIIRITQSLNVSRVNPHNWFAVMPLGIVGAISGFVMMIPSLLADLNILYIVAVAYILNAFSLAIYSIYMVKRQPSQKANEAKERAAAKKKLAEEKRKERDRVRSLSEAERSKERADALAEKIKKEEEKKLAKEAKKEARRPAGERTVEFTAEETAEIDSLMNKEEENGLWENPEKDDHLVEVAARPVFNKPTNIPVIEKQVVVEKPEEIDIEGKRAIVNLEEIENKIPEIELPTIELPQVELKSEGGEAHRRKSFLLELEDETPKQGSDDELTSFTPLTLEELFADENFNIKPLSDKRATETDLKLTQTFTFDWLDTTK